jgi:hypothetical protein
VNSRSRGSKRGPSRAACGRDRPQDARHPAPVTRRRSSADISSRDANDMRAEVTTASALATSTRSCTSRSSRTHAARGHGGRGRRVLVPLTRSSPRRTPHPLESLGERTASSLSVPRESPHARPHTPRTHTVPRTHRSDTSRPNNLQTRTSSKPRVGSAAGNASRVSGILRPVRPQAARLSPRFERLYRSKPEPPPARFTALACEGASRSIRVNPQPWGRPKGGHAARTETQTNLLAPSRVKSGKLPFSARRAHPANAATTASTTNSASTPSERTPSSALAPAGVPQYA